MYTRAKKLLRNVRHVITHKDSSKFYSKTIKNNAVTFVAAFFIEKKFKMWYNISVKFREEKIWQILLLQKNRF